MVLRVVVLRWALVVLLANLGCRAPAEATAPVPPPVVEEVAAEAPSNPLSWSVVSSNGQASLTQTAGAEDACTLRCALQGKQAWEQPGCLARDSDFAFVADDCATAILILEYPQRAEPSWSTVVAVVVRGTGRPDSFSLGEVLEHPKGEGRRLRWLAGVVGEPGVKPHVNEAGTAVEFSTLDGVARTVRFSHPEDFRVGPARPPPRQVAVTTDESGLYQYVKADGSTEFVMGLSQVPARYRKSASPVQADISAVQGAPPSAYRPRSSGSSSSSFTTGYDGRLPSVRTSPAAQPAAPSQGCVFGLSGPACDVVNKVEAQGGMRQDTVTGPARPTTPYLPPAFK